jgi:hypothetical protein
LLALLKLGVTLLTYPLQTVTVFDSLSRGHGLRCTGAPSAGNARPPTSKGSSGYAIGVQHVPAITRAAFITFEVDAVDFAIVDNAGAGYESMVEHMLLKRSAKRKVRHNANPPSCAIHRNRAADSVDKLISVDAMNPCG